jgi:hypothetical protein
MNDLIQRLTNAIIRQEGMPATYANPCNLRSAPWLNRPVISGGFWRPASRAEGVAGGAHCIALRIAEGQTLRQLITAWAPPSDGNDTPDYLLHVMAWASIPGADTPLWEYLGEPISVPSVP